MALNRMVLWGVNAALAGLCCWIAAGLLADVAGELLAPPAAPLAAAAAPAAPAQRTWQSRQAILDRNLFKASVAAPGGEAIAEDLAATKLPLRLLGTVAAGDERRSWAAVEDLEKRVHQVVRVADQLQGKAEVVRIERRRIVLRNGGRLEELALDEGQPPQAGGGRSAAAPRGYGRPERMAAVPPAGNAAERVQRLAENRFGVQRDDVASVANNPAALFSQARILPKYDSGKMVGVQVNAIKPGSLFEQIGIRDGDTITELNGVQITSQQDSAAVLREFTSATTFEVSVTGADGTGRRLTYEVR